MNQNNERSRVMVNTIFLYLRMMVTIAIGLYTSRVVLDILGASDFGIFSLVGSIITVLGFLNAGMLQASQRFMSYALGEGDSVKIERTFWASWYAHILLALGVLVVGESIGPLMVSHVLKIPADRLDAAHWVLQCSIVTCVVSIISIPYNSAIISHERMKSFAYISILEATLKLLIVYLLLVVNGDKLILYAVLMVAVQVLIRFIYSIYCHRNFAECNSRRYLDRTMVRRIMTFAGWSFLGNLGIMSRDQGTSALLNIFYKTTVINAARGIALQASGHFVSFASNITMALNPAIVKNYASGNLEESHRLVMIGCRAAFFMLTLMVVPFFVNIDYVLTLWLGSGKVPDNTSLFMYVVIGGYMIYAMSQPVTTAIQATGNIRNFQIWIFVFMMAELILVALVLWTTGSLLYAMIPSLLNQLLSALMRILIIRNMHSIYSLRHYLLQVCARCMVVFGISFGIAYSIHRAIDYDGFVLFLAECAVILITTMATIYLIGLNGYEREYVRNRALQYVRKKNTTDKV